MNIIETKEQILHRITILDEAYDNIALRKADVVEAQKQLDEWVTIKETRRRDLETAVAALADFEKSKKRAPI